MLVAAPPLSRPWHGNERRRAGPGSARWRRGDRADAAGRDGGGACFDDRSVRASERRLALIRDAGG
jgi:hypothetical protein